MAKQDLRDPARDRKTMRWALVAVAVVLSLAVGAATLSALDKRPADHSYVFYASYGNTNGVPYTLLLPLPQDGDIRAAWRFLGNGTAAVESSTYGPVLRIAAHGNITVSANISSWRDLPATFTTEGSSAGGRTAARLYLNATVPPASSFVRISFTKVDPTWTLTRSVDGDVFEGWNTVEIREDLQRTLAR